MLDDIRYALRQLAKAPRRCPPYCAQGVFLLVAAGLALGRLVTVLAGRFMGRQFFGVKASVSFLLLITTLILAAAALVASLIPAQRAAGIEPMQALRTE